MPRTLAIAATLLTLISVHSFAAQTGQSCETKARQIAADKREDFLTSCLAQISAPANVREVTQQNKRRSCEQNVKNQKLNPGKKLEYFDQCMHENEAATRAKIVAPQSPRATTTSKTAVSTKKKPSCVQQAKDQSLSGHARKRFMKNCMS